MHAGTARVWRWYGREQTKLVAVELKDRGNAHIYGTRILALESDDGLAAGLDLDPVLGSEASDDLNTIRVRHDEKPLPARGSAVS